MTRDATTPTVRPASRWFGGRLRRVDGPLTRELARVPGGAGLGQLPARLAPDRTVPVVCGYCSTGCSLDVHLRDGQPVNVTPSASYPVNTGTACPKGWEALTPMQARDRATTPLLRDRRGRLRPVDWQTAITVFVERTRDVQRRHGTESMAFLSTGQMTTEEMALLGALTKFGMGMVHGDGNTRQCMASAVVAYKQAFGFDAPGYSYADLEASDVVVLFGSNLAIAHPILWGRLAGNQNDPEILVVDPRHTETAAAATAHYPVRPASDLVLCYGLARELIRRGAVDREFVAEHTSGFEDFAAHVEPYDLETVAAETGLSVDQIDRFATSVERGRAVSFWWTMGVNQSHQGVRTAQAIINLALLTGNIGRPGTGANSVTGQCNAMGSRLFSNTTSLLGGRDFADPVHRREVAALLGISPQRIPRHPGRAYDQILDGVRTGHVRGLWVVATNTAHSWIDQRAAHDVLDRLDFLVVQDLYADTETARRADLVLPAAGWGEKLGTLINSERRIGLVQPVHRPPGQALPDFAILRLIARAWGADQVLTRFRDPASTFRLLQELSRGRFCDFAGIDGYGELVQAGGVQWPAPGGVHERATERRLFADGRFPHPDGRARFVFDAPRSPAEQPDRRRPFVLMTGRGSSAQWHTATRTRRSDVLATLAATTPWVELSPADARELGVRPHDEVLVASDRGHLRARAVVSAGVQPGQVFVPMHHAETNRLTHPSFDPHSRQPAYKHAAVSVHLVEGGVGVGQ